MEGYGKLVSCFLCYVFVGMIMVNWLGDELYINYIDVLKWVMEMVYMVGLFLVCIMINKKE